VWEPIAEQTHVVVLTVFPWMRLLVAAVIGLVGAVLVATPPALSAERVRVADGLRSE
jgi:hypothetical protein